jgi:hypothetical protein
MFRIQPCGSGAISKTPDELKIPCVDRDFIVTREFETVLVGSLVIAVKQLVNIGFKFINIDRTAPV